MMNMNFFQTQPHIAPLAQPQVDPILGIQKHIDFPQHLLHLGAAPKGQLHALTLLAGTLDLPFAGDLTLAGLEEAEKPDSSTQDLHDEPFVRPPPA